MLPIEQIHPVVVHFPIVFFLSLAALDAVALLRSVPIDGRGCLANLSAGLAVLAGAAAVAAYAFGDAALDVAISRGVPELRLETHEGFGTTTAALLAAWGLLRGLVWWRRVALGRGRTAAVVAVQAALAVLLVATAYYGGQLVYELGVNVARPAG